MGTKEHFSDTKSAWSDVVINENENIGSLWASFSQNTGFHAVNKLTPGRNYRLRCCWWTLAILCMAAYMSYNVAKELRNYFRYPTLTRLKVEIVKELDFPAVTVCNQSPFNLTKVREADPELESFFYKTSILGKLARSVDWEKEFLGSTFRDSKHVDWWRSLQMDPHEMFFICYMNGGHYYPCTEVMKPVLTSYGLCATFNFNASDIRSVRLAGGNNNFILFGYIGYGDYVTGEELSAGFRVLLHDPHVHPDAATSSFITAAGTTTYAAIKNSRFKYLPPPYKASSQGICVDTTAPGFNNTLEFYDTYTYEHCIMECKAKKVFEICRCAKPSDNESLGAKCSLFELTTCYSPTFSEKGLDIEFQDSCGCEIPCSFQTYEARVSTSKFPSSVFLGAMEELEFGSDESYIRNNFLEIRIFYDQLLVETVEQVPQYNTETVIGNLGGQMGICLGASILTLTELGEFILFVCVTVFRRLTHKKKASRIQCKD